MLLTPFSIVDSAIDAIIQAGGKLTHRFKKLIKYDYWLVMTTTDYVEVSLSMLLLMLWMYTVRLQRHSSGVL